MLQEWSYLPTKYININTLSHKLFFFSKALLAMRGWCHCLVHIFNIQQKKFVHGNWPFSFFSLEFCVTHFEYIQYDKNMGVTETFFTSPQQPQHWYIPNKHVDILHSVCLIAVYHACNPVTERWYARVNIRGPGVSTSPAREGDDTCCSSITHQWSTWIPLKQERCETLNTVNHFALLQLL